MRHGLNPNSFTVEARRTRRTAEKALCSSAVKVFGIPLANNDHPFALRYRRAATNRRRASIPQPERGLAARHCSDTNDSCAQKRTAAASRGGQQAPVSGRLFLQSTGCSSAKAGLALGVRITASSFEISGQHSISSASVVMEPTSGFDHITPTSP